jgi:hypothetical protein
MSMMLIDDCTHPAPPQPPKIKPRANQVLRSDDSEAGAARAATAMDNPKVCRVSMMLNVALIELTPGSPRLHQPPCELLQADRVA